MRITSELVDILAGLALEGIQRPYPYHPAHVVTGPDDLSTPQRLHPAFYGCFDWHSAVHGHWLLVRVLQRYPDIESAAGIRSALRRNLTREHVRDEVGYFEEPGREGFERTYGWAWLLKLQEQLLSWSDADGLACAEAVSPLATVIIRRYLDFLPRQRYPIRTGVHPSTAFGLAFALDYARATQHAELDLLVCQRSLDYYARDVSAPARWEPGGNEFFSPCLMEADLMRRVLTQREFPAWLDRFLPNLRAGKPESLLRPVEVTDRTDGQLVHLDGLNLSRAWCMCSIAAALPPGDARRGILATAAEKHAHAGLEGIATGHYMGDHWLGSFALYMLDEADRFEQTIT